MNTQTTTPGKKRRTRDANPTEADRAAAARLRAIWNLRAERGDQNRIAAIWHGPGGSGITQGAVSQYLNGLTPLNATAVLRFADFLGIDPLSIRDDLPELQALARARRSDEASPRVDGLPAETQVDEKWRTLPLQLKADIIRMVETARRPEATVQPGNHRVLEKGRALRERRRGGGLPPAGTGTDDGEVR